MIAGSVEALSAGAGFTLAGPFAAAAKMNAPAVSAMMSGREKADPEIRVQTVPFAMISLTCDIFLLSIGSQASGFE